jgi:hypothetical protein
VSPASRLAIGCHDKQSRLEAKEADGDLSQQSTGLLDHALARERCGRHPSVPFLFWVVSQAAKTSHVLDHRLELVNDIDSSHGPQCS